MKSPYLRRGEWLELRVPGVSGDSSTIGEALAPVTPVPGKVIRKLLQTGGVKQSGDRLLLHLFPNEECGVEPEWAEFEPLYEDDFCLVANKPAGMPVHPSLPGQTGTLANVVASYYEQTGQRCRIRHIHRLDDDTTGPVLYAKNETAHIVLDGAMREKAVERIYYAVVSGHLKQPEGRIDAPIGKDRHHGKRRRVSPSGDPARTIYEVLAEAPGVSFVRLRLETGRTHQIRVHMSHIGHPLIGDPLYGGPVRLFPRQALHGKELIFPHPWTGERIQIEAPLPEDIIGLWNRLSGEPLDF